MNSSTGSFWSGRKVLITGAGGFLGRHLVEAISGYPCTFKALDGKADCDLRDAWETAALFRDWKPDIVIHLAALVGGIGANQAAPADFFIDNIQMGASILAACRDYGVKKLVMVGTTCSYPKYCGIPFRESDLWAGYPEETNAPYGVAKRALMVGADALKRQYGVSVVNLIPTNMYGPGDDFDGATSHVIPALIRNFSEATGTKVILWGSGKPTRDFLYVEDCAKAILMATEGVESSSPINLGSGVEVSIQSLAERIGFMLAPDVSIIWDRAKPDGQPRRALDVSSAFESFGWKSSTSLEDGLRKTVEWYRASKLVPK